MRVFVTRVSAPDALRDNATKWQVIVEEAGERELYNPESILLTGAWTFGRDESGTPTVWLEPANTMGFDAGELHILFDLDV